MKRSTPPWRVLRRGGVVLWSLALAASPVSAHIFCGINATVDLTPRVVADGAVLEWVAEFCDASLTPGDIVEWVRLPVDPLRFVPGSAAWRDCPTGGCAVAADGALTISSFTLRDEECVSFPFTLTLQPGQRGDRICLRGPLRTRLGGGSLPCDRQTDDPDLPGPDATCFTVVDGEPGCGLSAVLAPTFLAGCAGDPASLSAAGSTATGCPGGLTYQWTQAGLPIPGATAITLDIPITLPPSGDNYRCLVGCADVPMCRRISPPTLVVLLGPEAIEAPDSACVGASVLAAIPTGFACSIDCGDGTPPVPACVANCAYAAAGSYVIRADAVDSSGCDVSLSRPIEVVDVAEACSVGFDPVCEVRAGGPTHVRMSNCSFPGLDFTWSSSLGSFDDANSREPELTLPDVSVPTMVDVALEASVAGCGPPDRTTSSFILLPAAVVAPAVTPNPACATAAMRFSAPPPSGTGPFTYLWDFGDTASSTDPAPTHAYAIGGDYSAVLTVTDLGTGCAASGPPLAVFVRSPCCASSLAEAQQLLAVKVAASADVQLSWTRLAGATGGYHVWVVDTKGAIPAARDPGGPGVRQLCTGLPISCVHPGGVDPVEGMRLYYQVRGVCGGLEGP